MASEGVPVPSDQSELLKQIFSTVKAIQNDYSRLAAAVEAIQGQVDILAGIKQVHDAAVQRQVPTTDAGPNPAPSTVDHHKSQNAQAAADGSRSMRTPDIETHQPVESSPSGRKPGTATTSRIILTTYPGQSGIDPLVMSWGHSDALQRGPVVVSRNQSTIRRRNGTYDRIMLLYCF